MAWANDSTISERQKTKSLNQLKIIYVHPNSQTSMSLYSFFLYVIDLMSRFQRLSFITFKKYNLKGIDTCHILHSEKRNSKIKFLLLYFNIWIRGLNWLQWVWWLSRYFGDKTKALVTSRVIYVDIRGIFDCKIIRPVTKNVISIFVTYLCHQHLCRPFFSDE